MPSNEEPGIVEALFHQLGEYAETRAELFKLEAVEKAATMISVVAANLTIGAIVLIALLLSSVALAFLLGERLGSYSYGFWLVAGVYILIAVLLLLRREKWVRDPVARVFIAKILE